MKIRYILAILLVGILALQVTDDNLDFDLEETAVVQKVQRAPLVQTALSHKPIDPATYTIEVHPKNEIRILGTKKVEGGYELRLFSSAPFVKYDNRVFQFHQPGEARFYVPDDRKQKVRLL